VLRLIGGGESFNRAASIQQKILHRSLGEHMLGPRPVAPGIESVTPMNPFTEASRSWMNAPRILSAPSREAEHNNQQSYASTDVRKTLDIAISFSTGK
jgi:hypothetical protein